MTEITHDDCEQGRLESLATRDADEGHAWRSRYEPGTFGCHEALHVSAMLTDMVAHHLLEHGAVIQNPEWHRLAHQAHFALHQLYQAIGVAHCEPDRAGPG